jgi:tetratricopeptide (TPR) repeat protein
MKILLSLIFLIFSSLAFSAGTNNSASDDQGTSVTKDFKNAQKLIYSKKYEKAIDILISLEDKKPIGFSKADLYNYLGFATRKKNNPNYEDAEEYYLLALSIDANHIGALEYLGELYFETDRLGRAEELLIKLGAVAGENSVEYKELFDLLN